MRIYQIKCDNCKQIVEEITNGILTRPTKTYFLVGDNELCPKCYSELKDKGVIVDTYGFAQFVEGFTL